MAHVEEIEVNGKLTLVTKFDNSAQDIDDAVDKVKKGFTAEDLKDVVRTPVIQNGTWWVWDAETGEYSDTGETAQGKPGYTPVKGTDYYDGQSIYKVASYGLKEGTTNILCVKLTDILMAPYRKLQMCDLLLHVDSGMILYVNSIRESEGIAIVSEIGSIKGDPGTTPHIGENGNWWIGETDTGVSASGGGEGGGTGNVSSTDIDTIVVLDQEAFDALPSRPSTTFYAIRG